MEIKRDTYLNKLINRMSNGLVKIITGIRRCGKSYLLNVLFYNYLLSIGIKEDHIIKFSFDSADDLNNIDIDLIDIMSLNKKVDAKQFISYINSKIIDNNMYYLLLDEVQNLQSFELVLNSYLKKNNIDVYVTGSNSKFLSSDIITEFEGRGDEIHLLPLSFSEYYPYSSLDLQLSYNEYCIYGGLPLILNMKSDEQKINYLTTQLKNTFIKDIINRYNLQKSNEIVELFNIVASDISCVTNPSKISNTFKSIKKKDISEATIEKYINCMVESFIISKALRYDVRGRKYISTPYKLYFEDLGLRNATLSFRQNEFTHIMENVIYNQLRFLDFNVDVGSILTKELDKNKNYINKQYEIDFVANKGGKRFYIQSAYDIPNEEKRKQECASFDRISDSFKKIFIVDKTLKPQYDENGYITVGIKEFLLDSNSILC